MLFKIDINVESRPSYDTIFQYELKLNVFRIMITIKFNFNLYTRYPIVGLDLNMSVTRLTARKMRVTSLKYLIKALDSYGMLIMTLKAVYA